jgi:hypothetical protein
MLTLDARRTTAQSGGLAHLHQAFDPVAAR